MAEPPGLPSGVQAVIVSHESRREIRAETLEHLAEEGIVPFVYETVGEPEPRKLRLGVRKAFESLRPWSNILFLEDDIRFRTDWRPLFDMVVASDSPTICCTLELGNIPRPWADYIRNRGVRSRDVPTVKPRLVPLVRPGIFYGSQCVYLPKWTLDIFWDDERFRDTSDQRRGMAFDSFINNIMQDKPAPVAFQIVVPDLAQHLSPPPVAKRPKRFRPAHMFDWEIEWT